MEVANANSKDSWATIKTKSIQAIREQTNAMVVYHQYADKISFMPLSQRQMSTV
jgi:hypothetical protein